jgi:hypothetical protein
MALFQLPWRKQSSDDRDARSERKAELQAIINTWEQLRSTVNAAKDGLGQQEARIRDVDSAPMQLARLGIEGYEAERRELTARRIQVGEAQIALEEYERAHDVAGARIELTNIEMAEDAEARDAARAAIIERMIRFEREHLRPAAAEEEAINRMLIAAENRWPNQRTIADLPILPAGVLSAQGQLRSLPSWYRQVLSLVSDEYPEERAKIKRSSTGQPVIYGPGLLPWG